MKPLIILFFVNCFFATDNLKVLYNDAMLLYEQRNINDSERIFNSINFNNDTILQSKIYFYLGNINFKNQNYLDAISYFKNSIRLNSQLNEARHNLSFARKKYYEWLKKNIGNNRSETDSDASKNAEILDEAKNLENTIMQKSKNNPNKSTQNLSNW